MIDESAMTAVLLTDTIGGGFLVILGAVVGGWLYLTRNR